MEIYFKNGSKIESIDGDENIRSKRAYEYMDRFRQSNNSLFNPEDIKILDYNDLNGKVLKMIVSENEGYRLIVGQDLETRKIYVLSCENIK